MINHVSTAGSYSCASHLRTIFRPVTQFFTALASINNTLQPLKKASVNSAFGPGQDPALLTRLKGIRGLAQSGRGALRQAKHWAQEDQAAARSLRNVSMERHATVRAAVITEATEPGRTGQSALSHAALHAIWEAWEKGDNATNPLKENAATRQEVIYGGARDTAVARMKICLDRGHSALDLSGLFLTDLPNALPCHITKLNISNNALGCLPEDLPPQLKVLHAESNLLSALPEHFPQNLISLHVGSNQLQELPENLPQSLVVLKAPCNNLTRLPEYLPAELKLLDVNVNQLGQLPVTLPQDLRSLYARYNNLSRLHNLLPQSLKKLNVEGNSLYQLPYRLPRSLVSLCANGNFLRELSRTLPRSIKVLQVNKNWLTELPENLPQYLTSLYANGNQLRFLPRYWPQGLKTLHLSKNYLRSLPKNLPFSLTSLCAKKNALDDLHNNFPPHLKQLNLSANLLRDLPAHLPTSLTALHLENNRLRIIPVSIGSLSHEARVFTTGNPFTPAALQTLQHMNADTGYRGPHISFSLPRPRDSPRARPLKAALADWVEVAQTSHYDSLAQDPNAPAFSRFLDRLATTKSAKHGHTFTQQIVPWLEQLAASPELREQTFLIAHGATESCEDRVISTYNEMQKERIDHDVRSGLYDTNLPQLVSISRERFRLVELEQVAWHKFKTMPHADEIEVYLAFQVKLRERLRLASVADDMRFFDLSGVTQSDLDAAVSKVMDKENNAFPAWLSQWSPWKSVLQRIAKLRYAMAMEKRYGAAFEDAFQAKVDAELRNAKLFEFPEAKIAVGKNILDQMNQQFYLTLTKQVLEEKHLSHLLKPLWGID